MQEWKYNIIKTTGCAMLRITCSHTDDECAEGGRKVRKSGV